MTSGINTYKQAIRVALGLEVKLHKKFDCCAMSRHWVANGSRINRISGIREAEHIKNLIKIEILAKGGDVIDPNPGERKIGNFVLFGENKEELLRSFNEINQTVTFEFEN